MKKWALAWVVIICLLAGACGSSSTPSTPTPPVVTKAANIVLVSYTQDMTSYGCPVINGIVKNTGNTTGYNSEISWSAYNANNTIIDTGNGFPADLGDIPVGVSAVFDAIFFNLKAWSQVNKLTYTIDWLNKTTGLRVKVTRLLWAR